MQYRAINALLTHAVLGLTIFVGCSYDSSPPQTADTAVIETPSTAAPEAQDEIEVPHVEMAPPETQPEYATPQEYLAAMQKTLEESIIEPGSPPTKAAFTEAIEIGDRGRAHFPDNEDLLIAAMSIRYKSLPFEDSVSTLTQRRLELGKLTRSYIAESSGKLGSTIGFLLLEEALAHLTDQNIQQAWSTLVEARSHGFNQARLFFLDPVFQPVLNNEEALGVVKTWIDEDVQLELNAPPPFSIDFELRALNRDVENVSLDQFRGKVVVLDFWGTWCGPCRATIPSLIALHEQHPDNLAIVGINFENPSGESTFTESKAKLDAFTQSEPIPYLCLLGTVDTLRKVPGFRGFPTLLAIDKTGAVRSLMKGYQPKEVLQSVVSQLLAE